MSINLTFYLEWTNTLKDTKTKAHSIIDRLHSLTSIKSVVKNLSTETILHKRLFGQQERLSLVETESALPRTGEADKRREVPAPGP